MSRFPGPAAGGAGHAVKKRWSTIFEGITQNPILNASLLAWLVAQVLKVLTHLLRKRRLDFRRLIGAGGMPSSHSSFVTALATGVGIEEGWRSPIAALALVFALIVMYDAAGVRYAAGQQAIILNHIVDEYFTEGRIQQKRLKELIGHTPIEVIAGAALGFLIAVLIVA